MYNGKILVEGKRLIMNGFEQAAAARLRRVKTRLGLIEVKEQVLRRARAEGTN